MRVLVTGGCGFLGGHVVDHLLEDPSVSVAVVSRKPKSTAEDEPVSYHAADISSPSQIKAIFDDFRPDAVIHTASPKSTDDAHILRRTNVQGTRILLEIATASPTTRAFIYTSSDSAVVPTQAPLTEDKAVLYDEKHFTTPYGLSKALADAMVQRANSNALRTAVLRLPAIYGENDNNFIPQLVSSIRKNEHKMQVGDNRKVFEFVYVKKAAEAHVLAARKLLDPKNADAVSGQAFFVSDGRPERIFDFARRCYAATGYPVAEQEVRVIPLGVMQAMASVAEWGYWVFTLGRKKPQLRRVNIDHLGRGCSWDVGKAGKLLGYEMLTKEEQEEAIRRSMVWGMENC